MDTLSCSGSQESDSTATAGPRARPSILDAPVLCADGLARCPWALTQPEVLRDHDIEWGLTPDSARNWFADLALEILQAGLAPGTALQRRDALCESFDGFEPRHVALLDDEAIDLMLLDSALIRNRAKLTAVVVAARVLRDWEAEDWLELTAPGAADAVEPATGAAGTDRTPTGSPPTSPLGPPARCAAEEQALQARVQAVVGRLRAAGVVHVGPGTASRFLSRTGRVPAHVPGCFRS